MTVLDCARKKMIVPDCGVVDTAERYPGIISETPGIVTEDIYDGIIRPNSISKEEKPPSYSERGTKARTNSGLDTIDQAQGVDKK